MITMQFNNFITALEKEVERRNAEFGEQGVSWEVIYPFTRGKNKEECVMVQCNAPNKKHGQVTMSPNEFDLNNKELDVNLIVTRIVDLATNKARGDVML